MSLLSELKNKLQRYYTLQDAVSNMNVDIKNSIDSLEDAKNNIEANYTIDTSSAENNIIQNSYNELKDKSSYLSNTIVPAIQNAINDTKHEIQKEEQRMVQEIELQGQVGA